MLLAALATTKGGMRVKRMLFLAAVAVLAFAGVAYAAGSITGTSIKDSTITGKDVKNRSLTAKDFSGSVRGARGATGSQGPQGPAGPAGPAGALGLQVIEARRVVQPGEVAGPQAFCPSGKNPVGTGFYAGITDVGFVQTFGSSVGAGYVNNSSIPIETKVQAICAGGGAVAASASSRTQAARKFATALAKLR
jgi:hypothetical protein